MDDRTKVLLCREIIGDFYDIAGGDKNGYATVLDAVYTVLNFVLEEEDGQ